jgi:suppressor for copper-sensitivity B
MTRPLSWFFAVLFVAVVAQPAFAQPSFNLAGEDIFGIGPEVETSISPKSAKRGEIVTVSVKLSMPEGSHTYPITKTVVAGGTTIINLEAKGLTAVDKKFLPDRKPRRKVDKLLKETVEVFEDEITWTRKYRVDADAPDSIVMKGNLDGQVCDADNCKLLEKDIKVTLAVTGPKPEAPKPAAIKKTGIFQTKYPKLGPLAALDAKNPSHWNFSVTPKDAKPGDTVTVSLHVVLAQGYHTFPVESYKDNIGLPTKVVFSNLTGLEPIEGSDKFVTSDKIDVMEEKGGHPQHVHHDEVTWSQQFIVAEDSAETGYGAKGKIRYQVCTKSSCRPGGFSFALGSIDPAQEIKATVTEPSPKTNVAVSAKAGDIFKGLKIRKADADGEEQQLGMYLLYAFLGGLILNIMPCVLPVIAIKALSFAQQAGEDRRRIFALNMTYSAGVVAVFLVLATLATVSGLGWGGLFQQAGFTIIMSAIVFAMGLSLLGVFEIPIPGFVGSAAGQQREGLPGAFLTGIFATVLATPCSGPFLGTALAWSVKQDPVVIYSVWGMMGVGMASPYIMFALFPGFVKFLPKPGNWMVRFKEFAGLILMGTTIFLLSSLTEIYMIPTLIGLFGVGTAVWMLGNLSDLMSSKRRRWTVRISSACVCVFAAWIGYGMYAAKAAPDEATMVAWQPFDLEEIAIALEDGKTVMIDFTANWCLTCHALEKATLNTKKTVDKINEKGVVAMKADWTVKNETIKNALTALDRNAIPTLAIFSPHRPKEPIVLYDLWTQQNILDQLDLVTSEKPPGEAQQASAATDVR